MTRDRLGMPTTTASEAAAAAYDGTILRFLEYRADTAQHLKAALEADPTFVMGHCLKGYLLLSFHSTALHDKARQCLEFAESRAGEVSWRERASIAALRAWCEGDPARACRIWDDILVEQPTDLLSLRLQHHAAFWMGRSEALRDGIARVLDAWDQERPGYGFVLGMYAFGLEESGDYAAAERLGRRAVELNADDLWSIHAVAHVLEMQGRLREGVDWLARPAGTWSDRNAMKEHLWWHAALFQLELGEHDRVLETYDQAIRSQPSDFYLDIQNAASMLWRLAFRGVDVGERWHELADSCATRLDDHVLAFTDCHVMMALAAAGRRREAERLLASLRDFARTPGNHAAATMERAAIPLCEGILAYGTGDDAKAVELLLPIRDDYACLGGSHAQRDVFAQLLIEAALRGGRLKLARALLAERVALRPHSGSNWAKYAQALDGLGDPAMAGAARRRHAQLRQPPLRGE